MPAEGWSRIELASPSSVELLAAELDASPLAAQLTLNHDPRWLATLVDQPEKRLCAYVCRDRGSLVGYVAFIPAARPPPGDGRASCPCSRARYGCTSPSPRQLAWVLESVPVTRFGNSCARCWLACAPIWSRTTCSCSRRWARARCCTRCCSPGAARADGFESVQHGPFYPHRTARVTDDYEAYLKLLGSRTRADLRATRKKFLAQARSTVRTRRYTLPAEVEEFVRDAMTVSSKTWQFQHLKAGLRDADTLTRQYRATAALGWFRSYVVYVGEQPVAFQVGHVYRDVFHAHDTGYDPQWAHLSAGNFQLTEIMLDLAHDGVIRVFDFDRGDFAHKQHLATDTTPLGYFHLIPATPGGRLLAAALRTAGGVSQWLGTWLERLGLRARSKRLSRSGLARRS